MNRTELFSELQNLERDRADLLRNEVALTNQMKARLRRAGYTKDDAARQCSASVAFVRTTLQKLPSDEHEAVLWSHPDIAEVVHLNGRFIAPYLNFHSDRLSVEKQMLVLIKELPIYAFVEATRGVSDIGLATIIADAGDIGSYPSVRALWKRFGVACIDGEAQRKVRDKEKAELFGFNPRRRAIVSMAGEAMIKQGDHYRQLYLDRKTYEQVKEPEARPVVHHKRAKRWMEKQLLKDIYFRWRELEGGGPKMTFATTLDRALVAT